MNIKPKEKSRILKLLALSQSPNESEAASALTKAKMLLSRYGLNVEDLSNKKDALVNEISIQQENALAPWEEKLLKCILKATYTEVIKLHENDNESLRIIGRRSNIITAQILYDYLKKAIIKRANLFSDSIDDIESFRLGMVESIKLKFEEKAKLEIKHGNCKDLVLTTEDVSKKENMEYIKNSYGNPRISDNWYGVDSNSFGLGKAIGRKICIDGQIECEGE